MGFARYYEHEDFIAFKDGVVQSVRREEQKCLIKWDERTAVPKIHQFIDELTAQLHARYPKTHGYIGVSILYSDFDNNMMPTNVEATISKNTLTHPNPKLERELCEKVSNFVLINRIFPLYYIKGKITQDGRCRTFLHNDRFELETPTKPSLGVVFLSPTSERWFLFVTENSKAHNLFRGVSLTLLGERVSPFQG